MRIKTLVGIYEEKRPLGRPGHSWGYNIKTYHQER
jgi:hypothetical protein